jgi:uncharacterized protein YaaQ
MTELRIDRLALITSTGAQASPLEEALKNAGFQFTIMDGNRPLVGDGDRRLLVGFPDARSQELIAIVRETCQPFRQYIPAQAILSSELSAGPMVEARLGGATLCILVVEDFIQI